MHINVLELAKRILAGQALQILDVRRDMARAAEPEGIPGALWLNPAQWLDWKDGIAQDLPVVVYCVHGHEISQGLTAALNAMGCNAMHLDGGLEAWKAAGEPTEPV